jgi:hypothetical protein
MRSHGRRTEKFCVCLLPRYVVVLPVTIEAAYGIAYSQLRKVTIYNYIYCSVLLVRRFLVLLICVRHGHQAEN